MSERLERLLLALALLLQRLRDLLIALRPAPHLAEDGASVKDARRVFSPADAYRYERGVFGASTPPAWP